MPGQHSRDGAGAVEQVAVLVDRMVDEDALLEHVTAVAQFDRYQASTGLQQAADEVARRAVLAGLRDVRVHHHQADGELRWWDWRAPSAWTPIRATLALPDSGRTRVVVDHAHEPFSLATYSAAASGWLPLRTLSGDSRQSTGPSDDDLRRLRGCLVVVDAAVWQGGAVLPRLAAAGVAGVVTAAPAAVVGGRAVAGRIELPPGGPLFAFSVTPEVVAQVAAGSGGSVLVDIAVDTAATMAVVSGLLPGADAGAACSEGEVWVVAHLCHPRPGANDNASGVAAALGVAEALSRLQGELALPAPRRAVRFLWGPEFLGPVATLHGVVTTGAPRPVAVVDLDIVGVDQAVHPDVPFLLERPPDRGPDVLGALGERALAAAFAQTADLPGTWQATPFIGFSDHALFAAVDVGCQAVQLCHVGDPANHSAGDAVDRVSPTEMRRAVVAAAALARGAADAEFGVHAEEASSAPTPSAGPALLRRWSGPLNVREMVASAPEPLRDRLRALLARDKRYSAVLLNVGLAADGRTPLPDVLSEVAGRCGVQLDASTAQDVIAAFIESGRAEQRPPVPRPAVADVHTSPRAEQR